MKKIGKVCLTGASSRGWPSEIAVPKSQDWWEHIPDLLELRDARSAKKIILGKRLDLYGFPHRDAPAVTEKS
jgi:hypothetical protein